MSPKLKIEVRLKRLKLYKLNIGTEMPILGLAYFMVSKVAGNSRRIINPNDISAWKLILSIVYWPLSFCVSHRVVGHKTQHGNKRKL
jgi:hypothetical protein